MRKKYLLTIYFIVFSFLLKANPFVTVWDLSISGIDSNQLTFDVGTIGNVNYNWETIPAGSSGSGFINGTTAIISGLPSNAKIRLSIDNVNFNQFICYTQTSNMYVQDVARLLDVEQWGSIKWSSMNVAFQGCVNLNISSLDIPDLSNVVDMSGMFSDCSELNGPINISNWDVINTINMSNLFIGSKKFNQPIGSWNTSNVENMDGMFAGCRLFDKPLINWNTNKVKSMERMFANASVFNQPLNNWNTSKVTNMNGMFFNANLFNQDLSNWQVDSVDDMSEMFNLSKDFNQSLANWKLNSINGAYNMLDNTSMDCSNYSATLNGWASISNLPNNINLGVFNIHYGTNAFASRNLLISKGWTINGDIANNYNCYPTSISTIESQNLNSNFYPNPTSTNASIDIFSDESVIANISVYNFLGQIIFKDKMNLQNGKNIYQLNTQKFTRGVYLVSIKIGDRQNVKQFVISK
jgi:surface protein